MASGQSRSITLLSVATGDTTVMTQFWIRAYVSAPTPDILDQQRDSAIKSTVAYAPAVVTTALPWSFFNTAVRESSLKTAAMGNITETPNSSVVTVSDRHNMFLLINAGSPPQQVRISVLDSNGNVLGSPFVTRQLGKDEMYDATTIQSLFGNTMFSGSAGDAQVRVKFEGLGGGNILVQNLECLGGPYAVSTTPTWAVGQ